MNHDFNEELTVLRKLYNAAHWFSLHSVDRSVESVTAVREYFTALTQAEEFYGDVPEEIKSFDAIMKVEAA
jgi:hypothetical protein